jgi:hypothetical protein
MYGKFKKKKGNKIKHTHNGKCLKSKETAKSFIEYLQGLRGL